VNQIFLLIGIGVFTGIYSGLMGLGGGTVMIPLMVLLLRFSQHTAVGTSLAVMLPPVTLPAVIQYWRAGNVKVSTAAWIALGLVCGMLAGQAVASKLDDTALKRVFGFVLIYVAGYTIFTTLPRQYLARTMLCAAVMVLAAGAFFLALRWHDLRAATA
jgi:hypothetical protein